MVCEAIISIINCFPSLHARINFEGLQLFNQKSRALEILCRNVIKTLQ